MRCYLQVFLAFHPPNADAQMGIGQFKRVAGVLSLWGEPALTEDQAAAEFQAVDITGAGFVRFDELCDWSIQLVLRRGPDRLHELELHKSLLSDVPPVPITPDRRRNTMQAAALALL